MYYTESQRKQDFTRKYNHQVQIYQQFVTVLKAIVPVIIRFNGKVVNVKLIRAFKEVTSDVFISLDGSEVAISVGNLARCYESVQGYLNTVDVSRYTFSLSVDENKRLDSDKTIDTIEKELNYLILENAAILTDINVLYDKEVKEYESIMRQIKEYENTFSSRLRRNIRID